MSNREEIIRLEIELGHCIREFLRISNYCVLNGSCECTTSGCSAEMGKIAADAVERLRVDDNNLKKENR
jgi:hypothetical protein